MNKYNKINVILKKCYLSLKKTSRNKFLNLPLWLWCLTVLLSILKIWLVAGQHIFAIANAPQDDGLFINLANNLIHFNWLGNYNNLTLVKGPFYPIWIALSYFAHIPLFFSQHLLYIFACMILVIALRPLFKKPWALLVIFAIILFNPISFADGPATRVIREGIYPALAILVIALFTGMLLRMKGKPKNILLWSLPAGIALSCFWLTREEGVWIMPFAILITLYSMFMIWREREDTWQVKIALFILPFVVLCASMATISTINYYRYGIFNTVEFKNSSFLNAYGALTRVKAPIWMPDVPVSAAQRQVIYSVSPAFSELKPFLEGDLGKGWAQWGNPSEPNEIKGGWFMWAFRDAVADAGTSSVLPVYRFNDPGTGSHFYVTSESEKSSFENNPASSIKSEGVAFYVFSDPLIYKTSVPIYKFSDSTGDFFFSTSSDPKNNPSITNYGSYNSRKITFYAYPDVQNGALPVYDFKVINSDKHFYTISEAEKESIIAHLNASYEFEDIAFYAYSQYPTGLYYTNGKLAMGYYQRLADEVNSACDSGKIACYGKRSTLMPPWNENYDMPTLDSIDQALLYMVRLNDFTASPSLSIGNESSLKLVSEIIRGNVNRQEDTFKVSILNDIGKAYALVLPIATILAFLIFLFQLIDIKRSYKNFTFIFSLSIAASFFARIVGLALINATSFSTINTLYLSSAYPLLLLFILLNYASLFAYLKPRSA